MEEGWSTAKAGPFNIGELHPTLDEFTYASQESQRKLRPIVERAQDKTNSQYFPYQNVLQQRWKQSNHWQDEIVVSS